MAINFYFFFFVIDLHIIQETLTSKQTNPRRKIEAYISEETRPSRQTQVKNTNSMAKKHFCDKSK